MDRSSPAAAPVAPAVLAKGALRRLAQAQHEPTPANFARAYAEESGQLPSDTPDARQQGQAWAELVQRLIKNLPRGGKQWTTARRKDSLQRVLDGSRSDANRLLQRLQSLMSAWESDLPGDAALGDAGAVLASALSDPAPAPTSVGLEGQHWLAVVVDLEATLTTALPSEHREAAELALELGDVSRELAAHGATAASLQQVAQVCLKARRLLGQQHRLVDQLSDLCRDMSASLGVLAEDQSWVQGQCGRLQAELSGRPSLRSLRSAAALLRQTREQQVAVKTERQAARAALQQLLQDMLLEVGELGQHAGRFQQAAALHAQAIGQADSLEDLTEVVKSLLADTRDVQTAVSISSGKLLAGHSQASELESQVLALEVELRRLSEEVSTDQLTQVANRRGLQLAFEAEAAQLKRDPARTLAVGLIDIDNFKKLNDSLGHAAGDQALKALAAAVRQRLRPQDHLARFGGEEFVVLLPQTDLPEAQMALTRLQRSLSEALFLHDGQEVFVTFSAGVTAWRLGEELQPALERADQGLYEAKRTGKNRTCLA